MDTLTGNVQPPPRLLWRRPPRRNFLSILVMVFLACGCLGLYPGCLAVPIPRGYKNIERAGRKIEPSRLDFVVPGQTTKAEFIEKIGKPYLIMDEAGVMAYYWKMVSVVVPWIIGGYGGATGGVVERQPQYLLLVSYDDHDVIKTYEIVRIETTSASSLAGEGVVSPRAKTINEHALEWAGKRGLLGKFTPQRPPAGQGLVYVCRSRPDWGQKQQFIDGVFLDDSLWAEIKPTHYAPIPVSPGSHTIGFEPNIRATERFLHPDRQALTPALTTTIDAKPNQVYYLEVCFIERNAQDFKETAIFSEILEEAALPKLTGLQRAR